MNDQTYIAGDVAAAHSVASLSLPEHAAERAAERVPKRRRQLRSMAWEQAEIKTNRLYTTDLHEIAERYPKLTLTEVRVCALVKAMLPSWKIAEILGIDERTVDNHRCNARRKMGLNGVTLATHLTTL